MFQELATFGKAIWHEPCGMCMYGIFQKYEAKVKASMERRNLRVQCIIHSDIGFCSDEKYQTLKVA